MASEGVVPSSTSETGSHNEGPDAYEDALVPSSENCVGKSRYLAGREGTLTAAEQSNKHMR